MKHRNSHLLVGYWSRVRKGRDVPDQCDIDPRAMKRMLASVFILDASDCAHPHYRLAGTTLCDRFGFELKGTGYLSMWEEASRSPLQLLLKQSLVHKQPVALSSLGTTPDGALIEMESVLAPISFGGRAPTRFVGMAQFLTDPSPLPGRPIRSQRLIGSQFVREDEPHTDLPEPPAPPTGMGPAGGKAPHLRLVVSQSRPTTAHLDMDSAMQALIRRLDIVLTSPMARIR